VDEGDTVVFFFFFFFFYLSFLECVLCISCIFLSLFGFEYIGLGDMGFLESGTLVGWIYLLD
jgi:hypothetical protein